MFTFAVFQYVLRKHAKYQAATHASLVKIVYKMNSLREAKAPSMIVLYKQKLQNDVHCAHSEL